MKKPDDSEIGGARKTLPTRKARKVQRSTAPGDLKKPSQKKDTLDREAQLELVKIFGER